MDFVQLVDINTSMPPKSRKSRGKAADTAHSGSRSPSQSARGNRSSSSVRRPTRSNPAGTAPISDLRNQYSALQNAVSRSRKRQTSPRRPSRSPSVASSTKSAASRASTHASKKSSVSVIRSVHPDVALRWAAKIRRARVSKTVIPSDGDCAFHAIVASRQLNSDDFSVETLQLMKLAEPIPGSNYHWSADQVAYLVSLLDVGLFVVENSGVETTLLYFNPQPEAADNVFLHLQDRHYRVLDMSDLSGAIRIDSLCEIENAPSFEAILRHYSAFLKGNSFAPSTVKKTAVPVRSALRPWSPSPERVSSPENRKQVTDRKSGKSSFSWKKNIRSSRLGVFDSVSGDPSAFLRSVTREFRLCEVPSDKYIEAFQFFVKANSAAGSWYDDFVDSFGSDWEVFSQEFVQAFARFTTQEKREREFAKLDFESSNCNTYFEYVTLVRNQLSVVKPNTDFVPLLEKVTDSVPDDFNCEIRFTRPKNFSALLQAARRADEKAHKKRPSRPGFKFQSRFAEAEGVDSGETVADGALPDFLQALQTNVHLKDQLLPELRKIYSKSEFGGNSKKNKNRSNKGVNSNQTTLPTATSSNEPLPFNRASMCDSNGRLTEQEKNRRIQRGSCLRCDRMGHMVRNCPRSAGQALLSDPAQVNAATTTDPGNGNGEGKSQ